MSVDNKYLRIISLYSNTIIFYDHYHPDGRGEERELDDPWAVVMKGSSKSNLGNFYLLLREISTISLGAK